MAKIHIPTVSKHHRGLRLMLALKKDPLRFFIHLMNQKGAYAWLKTAGGPFLMVNDAAAIKYILQTNPTGFRKGRFQQFLKPIFGKSIFLTEGDMWRRQRENAAPVFANGNFDEMVRQMVAAMNAMFARWDRKAEQNKTIDLTLEMTSFTLDALLRTLFHEATSDVADNMRSTMDVMLTDAENRVWSGLTLPPFIAHRLPKYARAKKFLGEIVQGLIDARRANRAYPEDLLSRLIAHYASPGEEQSILHDEVLAFLLSGHDTTSHALCWTFYVLAHQPVHHKLMADEVSNILGDKPPSANDLKKLKYTRQIFDEVLRLYPPVWAMSREAAKDCEIPLDDGAKISVPAGAGIMMCHYAVHRREKYWENPEAFDPNRFLPEQTEQRIPFTWFPFGGGPRICIGFRFAQLESAVALSMITQRYELSLIPGQKIEARPIITLRPSTAMLFNIKKRNNEGFLEKAAAPKESVYETKCPFHKVA